MSSCRTILRATSNKIKNVASSKANRANTTTDTFNATNRQPTDKIRKKEKKAKITAARLAERIKRSIATKKSARHARPHSTNFRLLLSSRSEVLRSTKKTHERATPDNQPYVPFPAAFTFTVLSPEPLARTCLCSLFQLNDSTASVWLPGIVCRFRALRSESRQQQQPLSGKDSGKKLDRRHYLPRPANFGTLALLKHHPNGVKPCHSSFVNTHVKRCQLQTRKESDSRSFEFIFKLSHPDSSHEHSEPVRSLFSPREKGWKVRTKTQTRAQRRFYLPDRIRAKAFVAVFESPTLKIGKLEFLTL